MGNVLRPHHELLHHVCILRLSPPHSQDVTVLLITRFQAYSPLIPLHLQALLFAIPVGGFKYWSLPSALIYDSQKTPSAKINYNFFPPPLCSSGSKMSVQDQIHMVAIIVRTLVLDDRSCTVIAPCSLDSIIIFSLLIGISIIATM